MKKEETATKKVTPKPSRQKIFGTNSLQISENDASSLVGSIVEKGISERRRPIAPPQPTVRPFPVARHRSHAPHWLPKGSKSSGGADVDVGEDDGEDKDLLQFDQISNFANPVKRKQKKDLDLSRWRELITSDDPAAPQNNEEKKHLAAESKELKVRQLNQISDNVNGHVDYQSGSIQNRTSPEDVVEEGDVNMEEIDPAFVKEMPRSEFAGKSAQRVGDVDVGDMSRKQRRVGLENHDVSALPMACSPTSNNFVNKRDAVGLGSEIDAENRARLLRMSADEIAEAQAEIMEKMDPTLIEALRKRGQNKLRKQNSSGSDIITEGGDGKNSNKDAESSPFSWRGISSMESEAVSNVTHRPPDDKPAQNLKHGSGNLWNAWSSRVEAVRELRFSLDGNVIGNDHFEVPNAGITPVQSGYNADNVSERDFLRTDGDPGAAGYTIKEAVSLTRSVVPGQRSIALYLLQSIFDKTLHNISQDQIGYNVKNAEIIRVIDWEAIWAFALGPEPELVLALRMCLDDNHDSVVLACAKVMECLLSCDVNASIFDLSEKVATSLSDVCTAPVFRSRPEIDLGFLQGGFWKYSAKTSNILPLDEDIMDNKTEDKHTIQDDIVVAGQDLAAGLVRMGILPRIRYLLESDPSAPLEECMYSILIAIARHSPTCANALMKCERLVQTVIDRFTMKDQMVIHPCKIKSVTLLKVLARSERKNCIEFIEKGIFRRVTWHLCRYAFSLDQWVKSGTESCKLSSALMVEQLRLWKVCVQHGYCVSYFSDIFPALCIWLDIPSFEKLLENNVLGEFAAVTREAYLVMGALTGTLPNFYSHLYEGNQNLEAAGEDMETWSWSLVGPMVDLALKWTALRSDPFLSKFFDWEKGNRTGSSIENSLVAYLLSVVSAVMRMLSGLLDRLIPEDVNDLPGGCLPWLPEFVPKIGLEIIKNGFSSLSGANTTEDEKDTNVGGSFTRYLCYLRHHSEPEISIASVSCLHGLLEVVVSVDKLIQLAKPEIQIPLSQGHVHSREGTVLAGGIIKSSLVELRSVLTIFMRLVASGWRRVQSIEIFGRGGPAPGVGLGWGVSGGGFWSATVLLAQMDARLFISLVEIFQFELANGLCTVEDFPLQMINSVVGVCLIAGPRDGLIVNKALDFLLQVPVLKYLYLCIRHFLSHHRGLRLFGWEYKDDDFQSIVSTLAPHFRNRWLSSKKKSKAAGGKSHGGQKMIKGGDTLETIHEESDTSNVTSQDHCCSPLVVEWAHQRLPLPMHWFLSPISTINNNKPSSSGKPNFAQDLPDILEAAKGGLFFLLGIEATSFFLSPEIPSPVRSVSVIWKLHSLSVVLLVGMAVLEEESIRDVYESLQNVYGQLIDESRSSNLGELIVQKNENIPVESGDRSSVEFLKFQSEIHESYSTFMETLVEQLAAVSYGDSIFCRQVAVYLHRCVENPVRLATWNALSNAHVLELLPPLENCIAKAEGYLEPVEDNECILEAYVKSWVSSALDRAANRGSVTYTLVLHHLSSFIFGKIHRDDELLLRNKLVKALLRDYSRKRQHEGMMLDFIKYLKPSESQKPGLEGVPSLPVDDSSTRFNLLTEACEGNSSLLNEVLRLKASLQEKNNML